MNAIDETSISLPRSPADFLRRWRQVDREMPPLTKDLAATAAVVVVTFALQLVLEALTTYEPGAVVITLLGMFALGIATTRVACRLGGIAVLILGLNFFFVTPRMSLFSAETGYPGGYALILFVGLFMNFLIALLRDLVQASAREAEQTAALLKTSQLLQACQTDDEVVEATRSQLSVILGRQVTLVSAGKEKVPQRADRLLLPIASSLDEDLGVLCVTQGARPLTQGQRAIADSVLDECRLALERNAAMRRSEEEALRAQNEQLRADMLRNISHDLRTPLTAIVGDADMLLNPEVNADAELTRRIAGDIRSDASWLVDVVENLLTMTRMERGQMALERSPELVDDLVEEAVRMCSRNAADHKILFVQNEEALVVSANARTIVQVISNIVNNACAYTPSGTTVTLSATASEDLVTVLVADEGPGIPDAEKNLVFEAFRTSGTSRPDGRRGVGLGLALCRTIVEAHGGTIWIEDNRPRGCVFCFTLPREVVSINEPIS